MLDSYSTVSGYDILLHAHIFNFKHTEKILVSLTIVVHLPSVLHCFVVFLTISYLASSLAAVFVRPITPDLVAA